MDFRPLDGAPYHGHIKTKFTDFNTASRHLVLEYTFISRSYTIRLILLLLLPHLAGKFEYIELLCHFAVNKYVWIKKTFFTLIYYILFYK